MSKSKKNRPVNLDLTTIKYSVIAIASIMHRLSGILSIITFGLLLRMLGISLSSPSGFFEILMIIKKSIIKIPIWCFLSIIAYHSIGGIRHILMECGIFKESIKTGTYSVYISLIIFILVSFFIGVILW